MVLSPEPLDHPGLGGFIPLAIALVIQGQQPGKVKPVDHFVQSVDDLADFLFHQPIQPAVSQRKTLLLHDLLLDLADPPVQDQGQGAPFRPGPGGHIPHQLPVGGQALSLCSLQPPLRGQVRVHHHKISFHHIIAQGLEQEAFAAAVPAHDEPEGSPAVGDDFHVVEQGIDFIFPSHRNIGQPDPGHHPALQGTDQGPGNPFGYFHCHGSSCPFKSSL